MTNRYQQMTDEELIAALQDEANRPPSPAQFGLAAVQAWALRFGVMPGRTLAIESEDLLRHFEAMEYVFGPALTPTSWGTALNSIGLQKGRIQIDGRDTRPRIMSATAASYFKAWLEENPRPQGPSRLQFANRHADHAPAPESPPEAAPASTGGGDGGDVRDADSPAHDA